MNKDKIRLILQVEIGGKKYKIERNISCHLIPHKIIPSEIFEHILPQMEKEVEKKLTKDFTKICTWFPSGVYEYDWDGDVWVRIPEEKIKEEKIKRMRAGMCMREEMLK